jgi:hypothetical protein
MNGLKESSCGVKYSVGRCWIYLKSGIHPKRDRKNQEIMTIKQALQKFNQVEIDLLLSHILGRPNLSTSLETYDYQTSVN